MAWRKVLKALGLPISAEPRWERADHFLDRMSGDPEWVRRRKEKEAKRHEREVFLRDQQRPLIHDLAIAGVAVASVYDFVRMKETPPAAFGPLLDHLEKPYDARIREGIARALTDEKAKGLAGPALIRQLARKPRDSPVCRGAMVTALTVVATRQDIDAIKQLLGDEEDAFVRQRLLLAMKRAH